MRELSNGQTVFNKMKYSKKSEFPNPIGWCVVLTKTVAKPAVGLEPSRGMFRRKIIVYMFSCF